jgi:hypothetical protein
MSSLAFQAKYFKYNLQYDKLNEHLTSVKRKVGLKRASSTKSLTSSNGETRTFAEILDQEVEKIVLFVLRIQGELANRVWELRSKQISNLNEGLLSFDEIENICQEYRDLGFDVLDLLDFIDTNVKGLRSIIRKYDTVFDHKVGAMYFDTRIGRDPKNSQLLQLYHQEGIRAVIGTIRRGFEDLYDAKKALTDFEDPESNPVDLLVAFNGPSSGYGGSIYGMKKKKTLQVPRISYKNRLQSFSSLSSLAGSKNNLLLEASPPTSKNLSKLARKTNFSDNFTHGNSTSNIADANSFTKPKLFSGISYGSIQNLDELLPLKSPEPLKRSISDLEPVLKRITETSERVMKRKTLSTQDYICAHSIMALEVGGMDLDRDFDDDEQVIARGGKADHEFKEETPEEILLKQRKKFFANVTLYINLYTTFLYMANQYVVAPSSGQYSSLLGMSTAMSGFIVGLAPFAALFSSLVYSMWSNHSFRNPMILCVFFGIFGNFFYAIALQNHSVFLLFLGRIMTGLSGSRVITRRYIADHVPLKDITIASTQFVTAGAMGLACGPLLSSILQRINFSMELKVFNTTVVLYRNVTAPGWIMFLLWFLSLFAVLFYFDEPVIINKVFFFIYLF